MKTTLRAAAFPFLLAWAASLAASAAEAPVLKEGVKAAVQVTAMDLDVVATKDGRELQDLGKDEFRVLVDGKPVALDFFSRVDAGTLHGTDLQAASPDLILETLEKGEGERYVPRQFLVFFDDQHLLPQERPRIVEALRDFVTRLAPSDRMSIVSLGTTSRVIVPYTSSKESLLDGLSRLEKIAPPGLMWDSQFRQQVNQIRGAMVMERRSLVRTWAEQVRAREEGTLQELRRAVSALAARSGKRLLLFVSRGFELHPGQTLFQVLGGGALSQFDYSVVDSFQKVIDEANRSGITIHALDGRGLVPEADASESAPPIVSRFFENQTRRESLAGLAEETGGNLVFERNTFKSALDQIYRESGSYYIVGATLTSLDQKKSSHAVKITTTRPGVKLAFRKKYAPLSGDDAARDRMEMALVTPDVSGDFPVGLEIGASRKAGPPGRRLSPFTVRFPISALTFTEEGDVKKATAEVAIAAVEDNGAKSTIVPNRVPIAIPRSSWDTAMKEGYVYTGEVKSRSGNFRFVAMVRDVPTGRSGIASASVRID